MGVSFAKIRESWNGVGGEVEEDHRDGIMQVSQATERSPDFIVRERHK